MRFLCGTNDTVAVAMHVAMKNGQICLLLRKFLAISPAIQKIASDCGCDAVVHLGSRKKSTKIKFLGPETARWGGGLPREGVVAENFVPALETLSSLGFEERNPGCPGNFAGMSRTPGGVQKVCAKKLRAHFSFPMRGSEREICL